MTDTYYQKKIYLAQVTEEDKVVGPIERWEAHTQGILHRGFTALLVYKHQVLLQHRKHPAFDGRWDLTFSSHQIYEGGVLQSDSEAILTALEREWSLASDDLEGPPVKAGTVYYKAKDNKSIYIEHEIDSLYVATLRKLPEQISAYSYGYELIPASWKQMKQSLASYEVAPWVEKIVNEKELNLD